MGFIHYLDILCIAFSLFITMAYHAYLWQSFKRKPSSTKIGLDMLKRKTWFHEIKQGDDKKGMLAVQSLRNALMETILTATIAIMVNLALAALTNNTYTASHLLNSKIFGSQTDRIYVLKFGLASMFLLASFLCGSMAIGFLIDANYLINASSVDDDDDDQFSYDPYAYTQAIFERGFGLAFLGNRVLCLAFPMLLWIFGPLPVALSSAALVWGLYELDFAPSKQIH